MTLKSLNFLTLFSVRVGEKKLLLSFLPSIAFLQLSLNHYHGTLGHFFEKRVFGGIALPAE